jgi:hypothetical protein
VMYIKLSCITLLLIIGIIGCQNNEKPSAKATEKPSVVENNQLNNELKQLIDENTALHTQLQELTEIGVDKQALFSSILNLSFNSFHAMNTKDYKYLESVSASGVTFNKSNDMVSYPFGDKTSESKILDQVDFGNIEYRGHLIEGNKAIIFFAIYVDDSHFTIDMQFINEDGWKFNGFITNA